MQITTWSSTKDEAMVTINPYYYSNILFQTIQSPFQWSSFWGLQGRSSIPHPSVTSTINSATNHIRVMEVDVSHSELLRLWAFNTLSSLSLWDFNTRCYRVELTLKVLEGKKGVSSHLAFFWIIIIILMLSSAVM